LKISHAQYLFLNMQSKYQAFVGGLGSGKTFAGCLKLCKSAGNYPGIRMGYYAPTFPLIKDIFYPSIEKAGALYGFRCQIRRGDKEVDLFRGHKYYGTVICRSMTKPDSIIGYETGIAHIDEIDILKIDAADVIWRRVNERNRYMFDGENRVSISGSPEGFKFLYKKFGKAPRTGYSMIQASTYSNAANLPSDYIPSLISEYSDALQKAYLMGRFVNLTSGTVIYSFDREVHYCDTLPKPGERLIMGMDFNVQQMAGTVFVKRGDEYHQVHEFVGLYDTPAMIRAIESEFPAYVVDVFPDRTGKARKTVNASTNDLKLLRDAGFNVKRKGRNPLVKDRVIATNRAYEKGNIKINLNTCPETADALEQQSYDKNGAPDKSLPVNHLFDAHTYPVASLLPINRPITPIGSAFDG